MEYEYDGGTIHIGDEFTRNCNIFDEPELKTLIWEGHPDNGQVLLTFGVTRTTSYRDEEIGGGRRITQLSTGQITQIAGRWFSK